MFRGLLRILATIFLALAVVMIVMDAARSLAADSVQVTALGSAWAGNHAASFEAAQAAIEAHLPAMISGMMINGLFEAPAFVVLGVLALVFYAGGHKPRHRKRRFAMGG